MAYKMKGSPLQQGWGGSIIGSFANQQAQPQSQGVMGAINAAVSGASNLANQAAMSGQLATGTQTSTLAANMNPAPKAAATPTQGVVDNNRALINSASNAVANTTSVDATKTRVPAAASIIAPKPATIKPARRQTLNPSTMTETPINPKAFSNTNAIRGVNGRANSGSFTRTVQSNEGPMMQLANPDSLQDGPELPPQGVQTSVTPTLGFENS